MKNSAIFRPFGMTRWAILACSTLFLLSAGGCGGNGSAALPSNDVARTALEGALNTWRSGGKPGPIEGMDPVVQVTDTPWSQGDRLGSYEIVKEDTSGAEKKFTVRLSLTKPDRVEEVQYHVMGQGPGDGLPRPGLPAKRQHGRRPENEQARAQKPYNRR